MSKRNQVLAAFGSNVRKARKAKGFTQEKLAGKADLDQTCISGIERGLRNPESYQGVAIASAIWLLRRLPMLK